MVRWTSPNQSTMRQFVATIICTKYNLYPTMIPLYFNVATFHSFFMLALIGFQMGDVIMSFMSLHGHWKKLLNKKNILFMNKKIHWMFIKCFEMRSFVYLIIYTWNVFVLSTGYQVWKQILISFLSYKFNVLD